MSGYTDIIQKFATQLRQKGMPKEDIDFAFGKADISQLEYLTDLYKTYSYWSSIFFSEDGELEELKGYKVPETIINFYKNYEPKNLPYLDGGVYLLSLVGIKAENSELSPGAYIVKYGLITFAKTVGGNSVCFDLNEVNDGEPRVVYVDNSWISFDDDERKVEYSFYPVETNEDDFSFSQEVIKKYLPEIDTSFTNFMDKLSGGEYENIEAYYKKIGVRAWR